MGKPNKRLLIKGIISFCIVLFFNVEIVQAKVYQCQENGRMIFKDRACEKKQKMVESGSDMTNIIAEKIKYDKRCAQKLIELVNKNSGKTLINTNKNWSGKKSIKHISNKVVCSESSGLTKKALSQYIKGEAMVDWANMMQWVTKDGHTLRARWGSDRIINEVTVYRGKLAIPNKPIPKPPTRQVTLGGIGSSSESSQCKVVLAKKWLLDFTVKNGKMKTAQILQATRNVSYLKGEINKYCKDNSQAGKINAYANMGVKPDWLKSEIDNLVDYTFKDMRK